MEGFPWIYCMSNDISKCLCGKFHLWHLYNKIEEPHAINSLVAWDTVDVFTSRLIMVVIVHTILNGVDRAYSTNFLSLDTFPYAGTTTTCESLYMGVPCVTMGGSVHAHNVGVSLRTTVGLGNLVAKTEDEYVDLAIKLVTDIPALSNLRMGLRETMSKSPLCDGSKFVLGLESAYRDMWRRYCNGDIPSLKCIEMLASEESSSFTSAIKPLEDPPMITTPSHPGSPSSKENGVNLVSSVEGNGVVKLMTIMMHLIKVWYCGLQPLVTHAKTKGSKRVKLHRKFARRDLPWDLQARP